MYTVQCIVLNVKCTIIQLSNTLYRALLYTVQRTVVHCAAYFYSLYSALLYSVYCTVIHCTLHCCTLYSALLVTVQLTFIPLYSALLYMHCNSLYSALLSLVHITVLYHVSDISSSVYCYPL